MCAQRPRALLLDHRKPPPSSGHLVSSPTTAYGHGRHQPHAADPPRVFRGSVFSRVSGIRVLGPGLVRGDVREGLIVPWALGAARDGLSIGVLRRLAVLLLWVFRASVCVYGSCVGWLFFLQVCLFIDRAVLLGLVR